MALFSLALCIGTVSEVGASCKIEQIAEFHLQNIGGLPVIDGQLNGQPIRALLGTGSVISYLTIPAAHQLNLQVHEYKSLTIYTAVGSEDIEGAYIKQLRIGDLPMDAHAVNVIGGEIQIGGEPVSLVLGADFFSHYSTEFDLSNNVVRLLRPKGCKLEQLIYWSPEFFKAELVNHSIHNPSFYVSIKLNGKTQEATLVSESTMSFISLEGAKEAGVEPSSTGVKSAETFGGGGSDNQVATWITRFDTLEIGGELIKHARLHLGDVLPQGQEHHTGSLLATHVVGPNEIVLGGDFFRAHRILIVPDKGAMLFTYNGGPVF